MANTKKKLDVDEELIEEDENEVSDVDRDVAVMVDIYTQLDQQLVTNGDAEAKPTPEDLQKMTVSIFIRRNQLEDAARYKAERSEAGPAPDFKTANTMRASAPAPSGGGMTKECPLCRNIVQGKPQRRDPSKFYYKCDNKDGHQGEAAGKSVWINHDGSTSVVTK